jgi:hypothetical protein
MSQLQTPFLNINIIIAGVPAISWSGTTKSYSLRELDFPVGEKRLHQRILIAGTMPYR